MASLESPEGLVKVHVDLPNHPRVSRESLWARPLDAEGTQPNFDARKVERTPRWPRFELRNIPFHAYGLNLLDVIEASYDQDGSPVVARVFRSSGHRTFRVSFDESSDFQECVVLLRGLAAFGASFESANPRYYAIDVGPDGDHAAVLAALGAWQAARFAHVETAEARVPGSFDAAPSAEGPEKTP